MPKIGDCLAMFNAYRTAYGELQQKLSSTHHALMAELSSDAIFERIYRVESRLVVLGEMVETIVQFDQLRNQQFDLMDLDAVVQPIFEIVGEIKRKSYDVLDEENGRFEKDHAEFTTVVSNIESKCVHT